MLTGRCHCGNLVFDLEYDSEPAQLPARACGCSFCVKHGGVWTSHPGARLVITVRDPALVTRYAFGTRTAEFHVCTQCGVVPLVTSTIDDHVYAVVNVNALENVDASRLHRTPANFEDETADSRLARRKRNWIGTVRFVGGTA